jgi:hypothetical protein
VQGESDGFQLWSQIRWIALCSFWVFVQVSQSFLIFVQREIAIPCFESFIAEILECGGNGEVFSSRKLLVGMVVGVVFVRVSCAVNNSFGGIFVS